MKRTSLIGLMALILLGHSTGAAFAQELNTKFMIFSDPHYYDPSLGTEGAAFQHYLDHDRKLLKESRELLTVAVEMVNASDADFVIIPGDMTKDGSYISHTEFAKLIARIEEKGKKVFVAPGNHDVMNGVSKAYRGNQSEIIRNILPEEYRVTYAEFGFNEALYSDEHSLSYIAEPVEGLWLFSLDACMYMENEPGAHPITDGEFSKETLKWISEMALLGRSQNKQMIAMMHHGIIEHYKKQDKFFGEYVVNKHKKVSKLFAESGINFVFTGHYHSQDISVKQIGDSFIYDVETGSLVTYPCPLREVSIKEGCMQISSFFIESIPSYPEGFKEFSRQYAHAGIAGIAEQVMISMFLKPEDAKKLSGQIGDAFIAHYQGDEAEMENYLDLSGVGLLGRLMILFKKKLIVGLHNDLPPQDNDITIDIETGKVL